MRAYAVLLATTLVVSCSLVVSCGGDDSHPAAPTGVSADVSTWALGGRVTDSVTGQPVAGAIVTVDGHSPITTDANGRWRVQGKGIAQPRLWTTVAASGFVNRETALSWRAEGRENIELELFPERAPFALGFYRYLVRNGLEEPVSLEPVRRWTSNPNFYIQTENPRTGRILAAHEVEMIVKTIRQTVPQLTGGMLSAGDIETGTSVRAPRRDYINVLMVHEPAEDFCGRAFVGSNPGQIEINYENCTCSRATTKIPPAVVAHEVGHTLGFWHVDTGLMEAYMSRDCTNTQFSDAERLHGRLAYRRPAGNTDPDRDPTDFAAVIVDDAPRIACPIR